MAAKQETVGTSPKAVAAAVTAAIAPVVVGLLLDAFGVEVNIETAAAVIGPIVLAAVTFLAARLAGPGTVKTVRASRNREAGQVSLMTVLIVLGIVVLIVVLISLVNVSVE